MDADSINAALFTRSQLLVVSHMLAQPLEEETVLKTSDEHELEDEIKNDIN
uniref:Uncharacterized protein n=1 Tax=Heterorhabditis bacteriophora TaxID=37862 RepID=A0A1I7XH60_HETBA